MIKMTADTSSYSIANRERIKAESKAALAKIVREPADDFERQLIKELARQCENPRPCDAGYVCEALRELGANQ